MSPMTPMPSTHPRGTAGDLLDRARDGLAAAGETEDPGQAYAHAHVAALRAAAAWLLSDLVPSRGRPPRSVWEELPERDPELADWAATFAASGRRRLQFERGAGTITTQDARTLIGQVRGFLTEIEARLCDCPARHSPWPARSDMGRIASLVCPTHGRATPGTT